MIGHRNQEFLVTPEEAMRLSRYDMGWIDLLEYCRAFFRAYIYSADPKVPGDEYFFYRCLASLFNAGVMQGQRQERKRKRSA